MQQRVSRTKSAILNSSVGFICLLIPIFLQFFSRKYFLEYLNVEFLGINGAYSSLLTTLALSELGFQTAVVYCLYKPLADNDEAFVNSLMNILRIIYRWLGIAFMIFPFFALPFLEYYLKGVYVDNVISLSFVIFSFSSAFSYFLAYKRCLLFADQKEYISKIVDLFCNITFILVQIVSLVYFQSYLLWCVINCVQVLTSNIIIQILCRRYYPYLHKEPFSKPVFKNVWSYTKNIIVLRFAALVYASSGNMIISMLLGATFVGYLDNYTIFTVKLKGIANGMLVPVLPIIGNLVLDKNYKKNEEVLKIYTFVRLIVVVILMIPFLVVVDDVICIWIGNEYVLSAEIKYLLAAEFFIAIYYTACCDFIGAAGLFNKDVKIALIGAFINITTSTLLALKLGITGVLIGTLISQTYFWIARSVLTFKFCIGNNKTSLLNYWKRALVDILIFAIVLQLSIFVYEKIEVGNSMLRIVIRTICIFLTILLLYLLAYSKSMELNYVYRNILKRR